MSDDTAWIDDKAAASINPPQVSRTLHQLSVAWPSGPPPLQSLVERFPLGEEPLLHLFAVSSICAERVARDPDLLVWLANPEICAASRGHGRMKQDLHRSLDGPIAAANFRVLRRWKGREMTRISLREIADVAALEETTAELSELADICITQVFEHWNTELRARLGSPRSEFGVIGLGKLGGRELNHSSDVDVIFLYGEEGQITTSLSNHEWFNRLAARIAETFSVSDAAGSLFRIDLRLRPEGTAGPLARSLESMENYYAGFGEIWERLALIKARGICGSPELAYDFIRQHQPFVFPKSPTPDLLDEIAAIKRRIERDIVGAENLNRDVKLGAGGIREIEFVVQALQFIHGARNTFLQEPGTLPALGALAQLELLPREDIRQLETAYRFLRRVEHRLQIDAEQQTHTVPQPGEALDQLARSLGFGSATIFRSVLDEQMQNVRRIFVSVIESSQHRPQGVVDLEIFADRDRATKIFAQLERGAATFHIAPRTRQVFRKLKPLLLDRLREAADPDATLNQFVRFVEAYGLRSLLFELLVGNPRLLELLVRTFDASRFAGDLIIRRPPVVEDLTRSGALDKTLDTEQHLRRLRALPATSVSLDPVRLYRQTELLRILLRDVLGLTSVPRLFSDISALAEACLVHVNDLLGPGEELTIVALGKFGGNEIGYGADLDVLFVGENVRRAQNLVAAMSQPSAEGALPVLDARLRPDGEKGPLACSVSAYATYYERRAQLWELQALTRARPLAGAQQQEFLAVAQECWRTAGQRENLFAEINSMLERLRQERSSGAEELNFKTGRGGIIEAEFLVQALQMRHGVWEPNLSAAIDGLCAGGVLSTEERETFTESYNHLRRIEATLRRLDNRSVSSLPTAEAEQRKLAVRIGCDLAGFAGKYRDARNAIHRVYREHIS
jgi:glutamate-ammonia-ligase adenylyltransferase